MKTIEISDETYNEIETLIKDNPALGFKTVDEFCLWAITGVIPVLQKIIRKAHR